MTDAVKRYGPGSADYVLPSERHPAKGGGYGGAGASAWAWVCDVGGGCKKCKATEYHIRALDRESMKSA